MPPVSPQSSRTTVVTWAVVFAVLWVISTVLAIIFYANAAKANEGLETFRARFMPEYVTDADLSSEQVRELRELRTQEDSGFTTNNSVMQVAIGRLEEMQRLIAGPGGQDARAAAQRALVQASEIGKKAQPPIAVPDNLSQALETLAAGLDARLQDIAGLRNELAQAQEQIKQQQQQFDQERAETQKMLEQVRQEQQQAMAAVAEYQAQKDQSVEQIQQNLGTEQQRLQQAVNAANVRIQELQGQLQASAQQINTLQAKLGEQRINTRDPITRNPDGRIIRVPGRDIVYINLGSGELITPGLTFEVYDKVDGIPPVGDPTTDEKLPQGKASIEVVRVGQGSSEARVVRQTPGTQITEGDLIANLIYDPNVKYNFVVYGEFDIDNNGVATPQDAEVIRRLVTQWGAQLMDQVNVDTDFVVLGREPVLPTFTREELQDPFNAKKLDDAQRALDAYQNVRQRAESLHIPILNQNRFLYLIGFYNQARR